MPRSTGTTGPAAKPPARAKKTPAPVDAPPLRTGENEREGWEDHERKREWFLRTRDVVEGQSRTQLRLQAIGEVQAQAKTEAALKSAVPAAPRGKPPAGGIDVNGGPRGAGIRTRLLDKAAQPQAGSLLAAAVQVTAKLDPVGATLRIAIGAAALKKVAPASIRMFRLEASNGTWQLVPRSGFDAATRCAWVQLHRAGIYAPIGLPTGTAESTALIEAFNRRQRTRESDAGARATDAVSAEPAEWQLLIELARDRSGAKQPSAAAKKKSAAAARGPAARVMEVDWWKLGPRNINGRIKSLAIHPTNRNLLLAGAANGGVWRTLDAGASWNARWFGQMSMAVGAIAFAPSNPNRVYAATGEDTPGWGPSYGGVGVYRSNNGGGSWALCEPGPGARCTRVLVHPTNADTVYVASDNGLWKSTTGGLGPGAWAQKRMGHVTDALLDPTAPATLYVAIWKDGVYKSLDGGDTWAGANGEPGGASVLLPTGDAAEWPKLAMGLKGNHKTQYIVAKMGTDSGKIFYSINGARTWLRIPGTIEPASYNEWTNLVSVHPLDSKRMIAGSVRMSRTINRFTWNATAGTHSDHQQLVYDPLDANIVYVATDGGVYRSDDGGRNWALRSFGMTATQFYSLGVSQSGALVLGGATQDQGIVRMKTASDLDWYDLGAGNEGGIFIVDPNMNTNLYTTPWSNDLRRSTDGGITWTDIRSGMARTFNGNPTPPCAVSHLAVRPDHSNSLVAGGTVVVRDANGVELFHQSCIFRSLDQGNSWMARKITEGDVSRVAFAPSDSKRCYAATSTGNFYRAKKTTYEWIKAHTPANRPSAAYITGIGVSRSNAELVYVSFGGYAGPRVMRSVDGGSHWLDRSGAGTGALPAIPVNTIVVDRDNDDVAYIGTDIGVFRTQDAGLSWHDFNDGWAWQDVPRIIVTELVLRRANNTLYASTIGRGVYRRVL